MTNLAWSNDTHQWAYGTALDPVLTSPANRYLAAALWRDAKATGHEAEFLSVWREKRAGWLTWLTLTQRKWQDKTRNPNKARNHDSISIREKYVRGTR